VSRQSARADFAAGAAWRVPVNNSPMACIRAASRQNVASSTQNRKYITYRTSSEAGRATATGGSKYGKFCASLDVSSLRYASRQTDRQTDRQIYEDHNTSHPFCGDEVIYTTIMFRRVSVTRQCVRDGSGPGWLGVVDTRLV